MTWKAKIKITGQTGSSLSYDGPLTTEQKDCVVLALDGETDIATLEQEARQMRARMQRLEAENAGLVAALDRLIFAAQCRDNTCGDPCRLIEVKAELAAAAGNAQAALSSARGAA